MMEYARGMEGVTRLLASECYNLYELYLIAENADLHEWTLIFYALNENESDEDKVKGMDAWWKSLFKKLIMRKRLDDPKTLDVFMRKYNCVLENIKQFAKTVYSDYKRLLPLFEEIYMKNYVRKHGAKGLGDVAGMFHSSFKIDSQGLLEAYDGLAQYDADKDESAQFCLYIIETIVTVIKRFIDADWKVRVNGIEQEQVGDEFFEFASGLVSRIRERMIESVEKECELVSNSAWTRAIDVLDAFKSRIEKKRAGVGNFRGRRTRLQAVRDSEQFSPRRDRSRSNCSIQRDSQF